MKTTKRLLILLLAMLMLVSSLLVGCKRDSEDEDADGEGGDNGVVGTDESYETDEWGQRIYNTGIPDSLDYGGDQVDILIRTAGDGDPRRYEWKVQSFEGDALNQAVYYRNLEIEEELGIVFNYVERDGSISEGSSELNTFVMNNFAADVGGIDIVSNYHYYGTQTTLMECYKNLMHEDFTYLHLDHPYWNQNFIDAASAFDRLFVVVGDMNLSAYMTTFTVMFNKTLLADLVDMTDEDLYTLALEGEWTFDKMVELCKNTYQPADEDPDKSIGDIYGFTSHANSHAYDGFLAAFEMNVTTENADGYHEFLDSTGIRTLGEAGDKLAKFYMTDDAFLVGYHSTSYVRPVENFLNGKSMFCVAGMGDTSHLRDMTDEYGLLPMPKYSTDQENYYGGVQDSHNHLAVMYHSQQDYEQISAVLELLQAKSYSSVRPTLFEKVIKGQYLKDAKSVQIFDMILAGTRWDFADIYPMAVNQIRNYVWRDGIYRAVFGESGTGTGDAAAAITGQVATYNGERQITKALAAHDEWLYTHY